MKNAELLALTDALRKLDAFKFDAGVIYAIAKNIRKATSASESIMFKQGEIARRHANGAAELKKDSVEGRAYLEEWGELLEAEASFEPHRIKLGDLKLGDGTDKTTLNGERVEVGPTNAIPPGVLAALYPIIEDAS